MAKKAVGYDVGKKHDTMEAVPTKLEKKKICYPTVYLTDEELPYLEQVEVGDKVSFLCLFEVVSKTEREDKDGEKCDYTLELQKVAEDAEMKMSKALEEFMGEHKEVEVGKEKETEEKEEV